jgi:hypothetical protein
LATILGNKLEDLDLVLDHKDYMTLPQANQPQLEIRLNNQQSILHQLHILLITTTRTREELERSWETLVQEEEREIL